MYTISKMPALGPPTHLEVIGYHSAGLVAKGCRAKNSTTEGLGPTNRGTAGFIHVKLGVKLGV